MLCNFYTPWSRWSKCSSRCLQTRRRKCNKPQHCGNSKIREKRPCKRDNGPCQEVTYKVLGATKSNRKKEDLLYDLFYRPWTAWGPCSRKCKKRRVRRCKLQGVCDGGYLEEERQCRNSLGLCKASITYVTESMSKPRPPVHNSTTQGNRGKKLDGHRSRVIRGYPQSH